MGWSRRSQSHGDHVQRPQLQTQDVRQGQRQSQALPSETRPFKLKKPQLDIPVRQTCAQGWRATANPRLRVDV